MTKAFSARSYRSSRPRVSSMTATGDNSFARYSSRSRVAGRNAMSSAILSSAPLSHLGKSRDPLLTRPGSGRMGPGFRRDYGLLYLKSGLHHDIVQLLAPQIAVEIGGEVAPAAIGGAFGE